MYVITNGATLSPLGLARGFGQQVDLVLTRGYVDRKFLSKPQKHALVAIRIIYSRSNKYPNKYLHTHLSTYCRHITSIYNTSIYLPTNGRRNN